MIVVGAFGIFSSKALEDWDIYRIFAAESKKLNIQQ